MKKALFFATLVVVLASSLVWTGCKKDEKEETTTGSIYGIVTDYATGNPIGNASVNLRPGGETTLTGSNGMYQFNNVKSGKYTLSLSKYGYSDLDDDYTITVSGNNIRRDVQLEGNLQSFKVMYNNNEADTIEIGTRLKFTLNVVNDGTMRIYVRPVFSYNLMYWDNDDTGYEDYSGYPLVRLDPGESFGFIMGVITARCEPGENVEILEISSDAMVKTIIVKTHKE